MGNLIRKKGKDGQVWRYEWNEAGMLKRVKRPDSHEVTFKYDALGRRIEKRLNKHITRWVWDGNVPLHEIKETHEKDYSEEQGYFTSVTAQPTITWVFEEGTFVPTAKLTEQKKLSIVTNYLGTPEAMYGEEGEKVWSCELNSYGRVRNFEGQYKTECPFRYQGQYEDAETGLYYNRFRYYSPEEGMYISQDPIGLGGGGELYNYVYNPNDWIDPLGLVSTDSTNNGKGYDIYVIKDKKGSVVYVGQTDDYNRREKEHKTSGRLKDKKGMSMERIDKAKTYGEARGKEQYYMDTQKTVNTKNRGKYNKSGKIPAGKEGNRANSFDKKRTDSRAEAYKKAYNDMLNKKKGC